jgi:hypothetical protein
MALAVIVAILLAGCGRQPATGSTHTPADTQHVQRVMQDLDTTLQKARSEHKSMFDKEKQIVAGMLEIEVADCPVPFQKAWSEAVVQAGKCVRSNQSGNELIDLAILIETRGASLKGNDAGAPARKAFHDLQQCALDYGVQ